MKKKHENRTDEYYIVQILGTWYLVYMFLIPSLSHCLINFGQLLEPQNWALGENTDAAESLGLGNKVHCVAGIREGGSSVVVVGMRGYQRPRIRGVFSGRPRALFLNLINPNDPFV